MVDPHTPEHSHAVAPTRAPLARLMCLVCLACSARADRSPSSPLRHADPPVLTADAASPASARDGALGPRPAPSSPSPPTPASPHDISIGQATLRVSIDAPPGTDTRPLLDWLRRCAAAVSRYYGAFPVPLVRIEARVVEGAGIHGGQALPTSPPTIRIRVGASSGPRHFERNWSMTHEMVHLGFPNVPRAHHWIEEGLATYVEPIARARTGWISEDAVWAEWLENMPLGLPRDSDGGLDHTRSWGRTYWGGALFCLLADVAIRTRSGGRRGLDDALRAIVADGGTLAQRWPLQRALAAGDAATGTSALSDTYRQLGRRPVTPDLPALWRDLGVSLEGGVVRYDERAPLAAIRRAIVGARGPVTPSDAP